MVAIFHLSHRWERQRMIVTDIITNVNKHIQGVIAWLKQQNYQVEIGDALRI